MKKYLKLTIHMMSIVTFIVLCAISIFLFSNVISLNIVPSKYLIPVLVFLILLYLIIGIFVFKKKVKLFIKIILSFINLIFIVLYLFVFRYLDITLDFMDKIKAEKYQIEYYYILVDKNKNYTIDDVKTLGLYNNNASNYNEVLTELSNSITYETMKYISYTSLIEGLFNGESNAVIMSAANLNVVSEIIEDFSDRTKIIHKIEYKVKNEQEVGSIDVTEQPFNIYLSGIDVYGDINVVSRSDVNMVITVNPKNHEILLTSIPRDYYVQLSGTTGYKDKLTHAGLYGINMSINTIEDLLDTEIDYYVRLNFTAVINLVDAIGGIEVFSDKSLTTYGSGCNIPYGTVKLNGECALAYSRERYAYVDGDRHRIRNQQDVIKAIVNKVMSSTTLITKYNQILKSMENSFQTNIPSDSIYDLINKQLSSMPSWKIYNYSLNGTDSSNYTYSFGEELLYVMEPEVSTIEEAKQKIKLMLTN